MLLLFTQRFANRKFKIHIRVMTRDMTSIPHNNKNGVIIGALKEDGRIGVKFNDDALASHNILTEKLEPLVPT